MNFACRGSLTAKTQAVQVVVADDKDSDKVDVFAADQYDGEAENIRQASCEMSVALIKRMREGLPKARAAFNNFYIIKVINDVMNAVREAKAKTYPLRQQSFISPIKMRKLLPGKFLKLKEPKTSNPEIERQLMSN